MKTNLSSMTCGKRQTAAVRVGALITGFWLATAGLAWSATATAPLIDPGPDALTNTLAQIAALEAEAHALSPTQKKIATSLLDALREFRGDAPRPYAPRVRSNQPLRSGGKILVDIRGIVSSSLLAHLQEQGATVSGSYPQYQSIRAEIPIAAVEAIAAHADVKFIRPAAEALANAGTATSEGYYAETADLAQAHFGVNGAGVKVGVISDSARYLVNSQANGDLGTVTVLNGQSGIGGIPDTGEGTAMLEIVHDLAPGSQLYFAAGNGGEPSMASNIIALADSGCGVIIDDMTYFDESPFHQNQPISQAVKTVSDRGVLYFSSAANSGNVAHGTAGTWTGNFATYGFNPSFGQLHNWGGTPYNQITKQNGGVNLFWSDPLGGSTNNYNLFITDSNGNVLRQSITVQNGSNDPYESVAASTNSGEYVVVALFSGTQRDLWVGTGRGQLAHSTAGNTRGHNAAAAANAFSVAAVNASGIGPGYQFAGGTGTHVENYSSDGFPRLFYESDGSAVTPNDLTASGGRVLLKPDIAAADNVVASTNTFGTNHIFTPFGGTSAAAPHAGAIAALIKSYRPDLTPYQIRLAMMNTALDIELLGFDVSSGAGIVMADAAMISVDNTPPVVAVTSPANNGAVSLLTNISGTASDIGSGLQLNQIHFTLNHNGSFWSGTYWTNTATTDPSILLTANVVNGIWTFTGVPTGGDQSQGTYYVSASARDNAGNNSQAQSGVTSTSFTISTTPPNVAITSPANGTTITNQPGGNWFQGTASGNLGISVGVNLFIRRNSDNLYWTGAGWGSVTNGFISNTYNTNTHIWQSTGPLPVPGSSLGNGDYHFIAVATDAAGITQQADSVVSVDFHPIYVFTAGSYFDLDPNNNNMNWSNPANWDVGQVPPADCIVVINNYQPDNTALGNVALYRLDLSGGTLTTVGMSLQKLNLSGGTLAGGAITIAANGVFNWSGGTFAGTNNVPASATLNLSGSGDKQLYNGTINSSGPGTWTGAGSVFASFGSVFNNSGTFTVQGDAAFDNDGTYYGSGYPQPVFVNNGSVVKNTTTGATSFHQGSYGGVAFNNNGSVNVQTGSLALGGGGTATNDSFTVAAGSVIDFASGAFYFNGNQSLLGGGTNRVSGGALTFNYGTNTLGGANTFAVASGSLVGTNTFAGAGSFNWSGGTISARLSLQSNIALSINGAADKQLYNGTINSSGPGTWTGAGSVFASFGSVFNNSGTFTVQGDAAFDNDGTYYGSGYPQPVFVNNGSVVKNTTTGATSFHQGSYGGVAFNNNGSVNVQTGSLALGGGGTATNDSFTVAAGSVIDFASGAFYFNGNQSLLGGGTNRVSGGALTFNYGTNTLGGANTFAVASGSLVGTNTFAGAGSFNWSGGTISARLSLQSNIALSINGAADKQLYNGTINSSGPGTWTGAGSVFASFGSVFNNSGTFTVQGDAAFDNDGTYYGSGYPQPVFVNNGSVVKNTTTGATSFHQGSYGGVAFNNNGSVNVQTGSLALGGGGTATNDSFTVAAGSVIDFASGAFYFNGNQSLLGGGTNRVSGGALTFNYGTNTLGGANTFAVASGSLVGTNTFAGAGSFNWSGGTISARLSLQSNIALSINGAADKQLYNGTINSSGPGTWTGAGSVFASFGSVFNNSGTFTVQGDAAFDNDGTYYGSGYPQPVFVNNGSVVKNTTTGATSFHQGSYGGVAFNNNGSVNVQTGSLALGGGGTATNDSFTVAAGSVIDFASGAFYFNGNQSLLGGGTNRVSGGALTFNYGTNTLGGANTFAVASGSLVGTNTFAGAGSFNWSGGTISARLSLQSNIALSINGAADKQLYNGTINSSGPGTWTGAGSVFASFGSVFNNSGTFTVQGDAAFDNDGTYYGSGYPQPVFVNNGSVVKNTTTGATSFHQGSYGGVAFNNNGTVDLRTGSLAINGGYNLSGSPQLKLVLGGLTPGTQYSQETFGGAATLGGVLSVTLTNGFAPTNGQSFALATYPSSTGQFSSTQFPPLPVQLQWKLSYTANSLLLQVVPANVFQTAALTNGNFQFTFGGQTGSSCLIEVSTNLSNWTPLLTNTPFNGLLQYVDPKTPQFTKRFYRATIFP